MSEELENRKESFFVFLPKSEHEFYRMLLELEKSGPFRVRLGDKSFNIDYIAGMPTKFIEIESENNQEKGRAYFYLANLNKVNPELARKVLEIMESAKSFEASSSQYPMNRRHYPSEGVPSDIVNGFKDLFSSDICNNASYVLNTVDRAGVKMLKINKQIILYGPPGSGKTYTTKELAVRIILER